MLASSICVIGVSSLPRALCRVYYCHYYCHCHCIAIWYRIGVIKSMAFFFFSFLSPNSVGDSICLGRCGPCHFSFLIFFSTHPFFFCFSSDPCADSKSIQEGQLLASHPTDLPIVCPSPHFVRTPHFPLTTTPPH